MTDINSLIDTAADSIVSSLKQSSEKSFIKHKLKIASLHEEALDIDLEKVKKGKEILDSLPF